jgi:hypothetical protein
MFKIQMRKVETATICALAVVLAFGAAFLALLAW